LVDVVTSRVQDCRGTGAAALVRHIGTYPRDALAVSAAVPPIAFSGVTDVQQEAWTLVEGLASAYGDNWWYGGLLAFVRQDQGRYDEADALAWSALRAEPAAGHAVHAQTHVFYETGQHIVGLQWLDPWIASSGQGASHRAHFSWHAALHELSLGDLEAVRRRYESTGSAARHRGAGTRRLGVAFVALPGHRVVVGRAAADIAARARRLRPAGATGHSIHGHAFGGRTGGGR
jgi:hypothetical protein